MGSFWIHPMQKNDQLVNVCEAEVIDERVVRDSGGHEESATSFDRNLALVAKFGQLRSP